MADLIRDLSLAVRVEEEGIAVQEVKTTAGCGLTSPSFLALSTSTGARHLPIPIPSIYNDVKS
jgi:hypothetical protein